MQHHLRLSQWSGSAVLVRPAAARSRVRNTRRLLLLVEEVVVVVVVLLLLQLLDMCMLTSRSAVLRPGAPVNSGSADPAPPVPRGVPPTCSAAATPWRESIP